MRNTIIKLLLLAVLLAATGFGSYKAVIAIWGEKEMSSVTTQPQGTGSTEKKSSEVKDMVVTAYYYDNYTKGIIEYAAVRFFNVNTKECNYIFFPGDTKLNLSDNVYQSLYAASTNIKQNTYLKDIATCFAQDYDRYNYTTMAIEDALGTDVDYYEAITSDTVIRIVNLLDPVSFDVPKKMKFKDDSNIQVVLNKGAQTLLGDQVKGMLTKVELYDSEMERLQCSEDYIKEYMGALVSLQDRDALGDYYQNYYELIESNTSFEEMLPYIEYLYQVKPANIVMTTAQGKTGKNAYTLNYDTLQKTVKGFLTTSSATTEEESTEAENTTTEGNTTEEKTTEEKTTEESTTEEKTTEEATTEESTTEEKAKDSKKLKIEIYNSTTINGLAARWKDRLTKDGYKITATETERKYHLKECVIYVSKKGQGEDLLKYFPNAEIKVGKLTKADIRIVLGTNNKKVK